MTRAEIIAELRRSAMHDPAPKLRLAHAAWVETCRFRFVREWLDNLKYNDCRTFFLLVACALEGEC